MFTAFFFKSIWISISESILNSNMFYGIKKEIIVCLKCIILAFYINFLSHFIKLKI